MEISGTFLTLAPTQPILAPFCTTRIFLHINVYTTKLTYKQNLLTSLNMHQTMTEKDMYDRETRQGLLEIGRKGVCPRFSLSENNSRTHSLLEI
jgi:hypothetical protein